MDYSLLKNILTALDTHHNTTLFDLVLQILCSADPAVERHHTSMLTRIPDILDLFMETSASAVQASTL